MGSQQLSLVFPILLIVIFYFLLIRPQKKREKKITDMRNNINIGDNVVTIGGFKGKVKKVTEEVITLELKPDGTKVEISKWAISSNESAAEVEVTKPAKKDKKKEEPAIDPAEAVDVEVVNEVVEDK